MAATQTASAAGGSVRASRRHAALSPSAGRGGQASSLR